MKATQPPCLLWVGEKENLVLPHTAISAIQRVLMSYTERVRSKTRKKKTKPRPSVKAESQQPPESRYSGLEKKMASPIIYGSLYSHRSFAACKYDP